MCPRRMCQSLAVSFSVTAETSPTMMLSIILCKFAVRSPLRIVMEPLVILILHLHMRTCALELPKLSTREDCSLDPERDKFMRARTCPSNILMRMLPMPTILHTTSLPIKTEPPSKDLYVLSTLFLGTCGMCTPSQVTKYLSTFPFLTELSRHHIGSHLLRQ